MFHFQSGILIVIKTRSFVCEMRKQSSCMVDCLLLEIQLMIELCTIIQHLLHFIDILMVTTKFMSPYASLHFLLKKYELRPSVWTSKSCQAGMDLLTRSNILQLGLCVVFCTNMTSKFYLLFYSFTSQSMIQWLDLVAIWTVAVWVGSLHRKRYRFRKLSL